MFIQFLKCVYVHLKILASFEGGRDGVYTVAFGALAHGGMMEAEARSAALRIMGIQVEEAEFTPERQTMAVC